jgi:signal transduction histidine kinase
LRRRGDLLEIRAQDNGGPPRTAVNGSSSGSGRGLIGMRERLALAGGRLVQAEPTDAGFVVRAEVPVEARATATAREPIG